MNYQNTSKKKFALLVSTMGTMMFANANQFEPSTTPIFSTPQAKPNIHMVLDDSGSMQSQDVIAPEHLYEFGSPTCKQQSPAWHQERKDLGEYDPFKDGKYVPWDDSKAIDGLINGLKKPPRIMDCADIKRTEALNNAVSTILYKYRSKAYLGVSVLWQVNSIASATVADSVIRLPIDDYSSLKEKDFQKKVIDVVAKLIDTSPGRTPLNPAVYEAVKMFRGQPVNLLGLNAREKGYPIVEAVTEDGYTFYPYKQLPTPLRYRCQQNHLIVMTDGIPNETIVWGIGENDAPDFPKKSTDKIVNGLNVSQMGVYIKADLIGKLTATVDLRKEHKPVLKDGIWVEKTEDDAGKSWMDELSNKMPINTHSVSLFVNPTSSVYTALTKPTGGMNLGFGKDEGNAEDLLLAFDTIFSSIIKSTSSTMSTNDRNNAEVLENVPMVDGDVDLSKAGTIRYDTTYNFNQQMGNVRAMIPYIASYTNVNGDKKPVIEVMELWNTDNTIKPEQGNYVTFLDSKNGKEITYIDNPDVAVQFKNIHQASRYGEKFNENYTKWLTSSASYDGGNGLRSRLKPMGSITNSDLILANKDILNINIAKDKMDSSLAKDLVKYLKFKAANQAVNYLIVADNDGFINFINAQRGLTGSAKAGRRNTAYFPQLLAHRLAEIADENRVQTLVLEGKTKLADVKVHEANTGNIYATIGLTSMGSGGKGVVGYRVYGAPENLKPSSNDKYLTKVTPLFEITNEGPDSYKTAGFKDLGYTYSGFEIFNQMIDGKGQAVAIFGNGFGVDKSVLYFIDAYTGEKLHEIVLNHNGGGASTPSIVVRASNGGQGLERIYVGDYSGQLYRVDFKGKKITDDSVTVTALFKASSKPSNEGQSAISVKPLVTKNKSTNLYNVAFGTGNAASHTLDRGSNSLVEHSVYNVIDHDQTTAASTATVYALSKPGAKLSTLLTIDNLKVGEVAYTAGANIDYSTEAKHDLEITMPESSNQVTSQNGWAARLVADGTSSGERTIQSAKYDAAGNNIVFVTWGIRERNSDYVEGALYDPCLSDSVFGKVLSFDAHTGKSSGKKGIYNQGSTGTAEGGLTGEWIENSPEGNEVADLDGYEDGLTDEISKITGDDDSSYNSDDESSKLDCVGDIFAQTGCVESIPEDAAPLEPGRVNFKKINAYY